MFFFVVVYRLSTQIKSPIATTAKVTFVGLPMDGQDKENNQPAEENEPVEMEEKAQQQVCNNNAKDPDSDDGAAKIIPWRAQLRKTNSTLNLLE